MGGQFGCCRIYSAEEMKSLLHQEKPKVSRKAAIVTGMLTVSVVLVTTLCLVVPPAATDSEPGQFSPSEPDVGRRQLTKGVSGMQIRGNFPKTLLQQAKDILREVPLVDGHNDHPWNIREFCQNKLTDYNFSADLTKVEPWASSKASHTDLPRLKRGLVGGQFWVAYCPCSSQYKDAVQCTYEQIDIIKRLVDTYSDDLQFATTADGIKEAHSRGKVASLIGVEGGHSVGNSLAVMRTMAELGVRYMTLTHSCNTPWADSSIVDNPGMVPEHNGLTDFGKIVVKEMNRLGMMVDVSHVSAQTMKDAIQTSRAPVIFSHSSAYALCNNTRNVPDDVLRMVRDTGGLVMVNFYSDFLTTSKHATLQDVVAHINHIRDVAGVDNVGIGSDFDGITRTPVGLEDVSKFPYLFEELLKDPRWTKENLKKLAGVNMLRVFRKVEQVRYEMKQKGVGPFEDWISLGELGENIQCVSNPEELPHTSF